MRISKQSLNQSIKNELYNTIAQAIADLKNKDEALSFLKDFFTKAELEAFAKRLAVAYWLRKRRTYQNIKDNLKVSSATVASIERQMKKEGFQLIIKKIEAEEWANIWSERIKKFKK
jgi:TrpR-related protein YerC/YecD